MKKSILKSSLFVGVFLLAFGCVKVTDPKKNMDQTLAEIDRDLKKQLTDLDQLQTSLIFKTGGLPGRITLNGVTVDADKVDSRITISQIAGLDQSGSATLTVGKKSVVLNELSAEQTEKNKKTATDTEANKTYINLGCELTESEVAGLSDTSAAVDLSKNAILSASRIFICGEINFPNLLLILNASDIMLKDASIVQNQSLGIVSLNSNSLVLMGKNKIKTVGQDSGGIVMTAASIEISVAREIYGDGSLILESIGGNNVKTEKTEN